MNRTIVLALLLLPLSISSLGRAHEDLRYSKDDQGNTLIFRARPDKSLLLSGLATLSIIPCFEFLIEKPISWPRRILGLLTLEVPFGLMGTYSMYLYSMQWYRFHKPTIILDTDGIWHELWKHKVLWSDVTDITYAKKHHYITLNSIKYYQGYSWQITLHTKQAKKYCIDGRLVEPLHTGPDPEKNITIPVMKFQAVDIVCKLIHEYHRISVATNSGQ